MKLEKYFYDNVLANLHDGLYIVDTERVIRYWNKAAEEITGFKAKDVLGTSCSDNILVHVDEEGNNLCLGSCPLAATLSDMQPRTSEVYLHHKEGHRIPISIRISPLRDENGHVIGGVELFSDISHRSALKSRIKELEKLAFLDPLTELANRHYIQKELETRHSEKIRSGIPFGILFFDIDNFKQFNDDYGHPVGDEVLKVVAKTFLSNSRPFDLYGRWGGEEFIGIIRNVDAHELEIHGDRMRRMVEASYIRSEHGSLNVTVSLGATLFKDGDTIEEVIQRADILLRASKAQGKNCLTLG